MAVALAGQLREGTKKSHTMAENTGFVACFLKGVVEKKSYRKLISDLYFVYEAMEEEIERLVNEEHPVIKPIGFKSLFRKETLVNDLKFYFGENWKNEINISHSAKEYVERIREVAKNSPELLVGHHYTRYIGDLSGGQILKRIAKKALNLQGNDGLNFYEFELIADEKKFKEEYSLTLNQLPINQKTADQIIDEANQAFTYNMKMFKELEGNLIAVLGTSQKLLAILDYQPLIQESKYLEKYCSSLGSIKKKYSAFDNNKMKNIYDSKKYFSPWVIICRGNKLNLDRDLNNIFHSFVNNYLNIYKSNPVNQFLNAEEIKINQIKYDKYSFEKDPADKLFKSFFGEKWTKKFINKFLFTLNNEIIH